MASSNFSNHFTGDTAIETRFFTSTKLFGTCASWMFLSFIIVQAFTYFRHYNKDSKLIKTIVYVVILLQLIQAGTDSYVAYGVDSAGWGDPNILSDASVTILDDLQPILESLTAFIVQCFFTWRIWTFSTAFIIQSRNKMVARLSCAFIALMSLLSLGTGLTAGIAGFVLAFYPRWINTVVGLWFTSSAAADIAITISMMALLLHARAGSCFGETRDLLSRLTRIVLQSGLLTTVLALVVLPLFFRDIIGLYTLPLYILGKSYIISFLANLNARRRANAPVVHGSGINQAIPATKLSTVVFSPANCHNGGEGNSDSVAASLSVHSAVRMNSPNGSINPDIAEERKQGV